MDYTHTFEMDMDGVDVEGEVTFADSGHPHVKFNTAPEVSVDELNAITNLLARFCEIHCTIGEIRKIELNKKTV